MMRSSARQPAYEMENSSRTRRSRTTTRVTAFVSGALLLVLFNIRDATIRIKVTTTTPRKVNGSFDDAFPLVINSSITTGTLSTSFSESKLDSSVGTGETQNQADTDDDDNYNGLEKPQQRLQTTINQLFQPTPTTQRKLASSVGTGETQNQADLDDNYDGLKLLGIFDDAFPLVINSSITAGTLSTSFSEPKLDSSVGTGETQNQADLDGNYDGLEKPQQTLQTTINQLFQAIPNGRDERSRPLTLTNIIEGKSKHEQDGVVLVTQMSTSKFSTLLTSLEHWKGPASVAIYITTEAEIDLFFQFIRSQAAVPETPIHRASFHLVLEKRSRDTSYPHNILRNVAMDNAGSDYVLLMDVDFIPSSHSYNSLQNLLHRSGSDSLTTKLRQQNMVFVMPAFQLFPAANGEHADPTMLPENKAYLLKMIAGKKIGRFHHRLGVGHKATDYPIWLKYAAQKELDGTNNRNNTASKEESYYYPISIKRKVDREFWEPYVVAYRPAMPRYYEAYRGFGRNKLSFFNELLAANFKFAVLKDVFCVHLDHPLARRFTPSHGVNKQIYHGEFQEYLQGRYGFNITSMKPTKTK